MTSTSPQIDAIKTVPEIIRAASASNLGILALIILVLGVLAYVFFKDAPVNIRVWIFASLLVGAVLFAVAILKAAKLPKPILPIATDAITEIDGTVVDERGKTIAFATVTSPQGTSLANSETNGVFHITVITPGQGKRTSLHAQKPGYEPWDASISPKDMLSSVLIQLNKQGSSKVAPTPVPSNHGARSAPEADSGDVNALKFEIDGRVKAVQSALDRIGNNKWIDETSTDQLSTAWAGSALNLVASSLDHGSNGSPQFRDTPFLSLILGVKTKASGYPQDRVDRSIKAYNDIKEFCDEMPSYKFKDDPSRRLSPQQVKDAVDKLRKDTASLSIQ